MLHAHRGMSLSPEELAAKVKQCVALATPLQTRLERNASCRHLRPGFCWRGATSDAARIVMFPWLS